MKPLYTAILTLVFIANGWVVFAQDWACRVQCAIASTDAVVVATDVMQGASSYRLLVDGAVSPFTATVSSGRVRYALPVGALIAGAHALVIKADTGTSTETNTLTVKPSPSWVCSVPASVKRYSNGDKQYTLRCPSATPFNRGNSVKTEQP